MTASQSLRSLELKRYTTRQASPGDIRANRIALTAEGRQVALETIKRLAATHTKFFEPLADETAAVVGYFSGSYRRINWSNRYRGADKDLAAVRVIRDEIDANVQAP
jgi:DNA-binding MarR family transcriptional regulator